MPNNKGYLTAKTDIASDEYFTPDYAVTPLLEYLEWFKKYYNRQPIIWCPFDKENSEYVKIFKKQGYTVYYSHIDIDDENFFTYECPYDYDFIISNPPFSIKDDILKRLYELDKPYAILLPLPSLQGQKRFKYLQDAQAMIFNKRINFWKDEEHTEMDKGAAFASIYICKDFLPSDLVFKELD